MAPNSISNSPTVRELDSHSDPTSIILHQAMNMVLSLANDSSLSYLLRDVFSGVSATLWLALQDYEKGKKVNSK